LGKGQQQITRSQLPQSLHVGAELHKHGCRIALQAALCSG